MPTPAQILAGLTAIARDWTDVAIAWHLAVGAALGAVLLGWRPTLRFARALIAILPGSVAAFAFAYGNPFNGVVFTVTTVALVTLADREGEAAVGGAPAWARWAGVAMIAFGWVYPHFLAHDPVEYLYAAPVGLVPCPSLSMAIGLTLLAGGTDGRGWRLTLAGVGAFYGAFGVVRLGVAIDVGLVAGAIALTIAALAGTSVSAGRAARPPGTAVPSPSPG